jgi:thymidylate synthase
MNTVVNMRSSDCWLGVPYDVFNFTMMTATIMLRLRKLGMRDLKIGTLYINAGSRHIYEKQWVKTVSCIDDNSVDFEYDDFDPYMFNDEQHLLQYLQDLADKKYHANLWIAPQLRKHWS